MLNFGKAEGQAGKARSQSKSPGMNPGFPLTVAL
jgi:hypothetical protein